MSKNKSKFIALLLAVFTGPLSFLYVRKWKKTLLLLPLVFIPYLNILIYFFTLFSVVGDANKYNKEKLNDIRFGLVVCKCGFQNKALNKFCIECGAKLTKACKSCSFNIPKDQLYCNYCGFQFEDLVKKRIVSKKVAVFGLTSLFTLMALTLTSLVAVEQHEARNYVDNLRLVNFEFPDKIGSNSFKIHYELSEKRLPSVKGLSTFINGTDVYVNDNEAVFDGKNIDWIVHVKKKGLVYFNVSLYDDNRLLDLGQYSIDVAA